MPPETFDEYLNLSNLGLQVAITLRHLTTGDRYSTLQYVLKVPHNTISTFIAEVHQVSVQVYLDESCLTEPN